MQNEIYVDIRGFEGKYQVSNLGNVKSLERKASIRGSGFRVVSEKILSPAQKENGYLIVNLSGGSGKNRYVHRLVCDAFHENPLNKAEVNHKNGIKTDNRAENLEWASRSENISHSYRTGIRKAVSGEDCTRAKLTNCNAADIRDAYVNGSSLRTIAKFYNVHQSVIGGIIKGVRFKGIYGVYSQIDIDSRSKKIVGTENVRAVLSENDVYEIRSLYDEKKPLIEIAKQFKVTKQNVILIGKRKSWKSLKEQYATK